MYQIDPYSLRIIRTVVNLTQKQLADLAGVSRAYISYLELGERPMIPTIQKRLQDVLGWNTPETQAIIAAVEAWRQPHEDI